GSRRSRSRTELQTGVRRRRACNACVARIHYFGDSRTEPLPKAGMAFEHWTNCRSTRPKFPFVPAQIPISDDRQASGGLASKGRRVVDRDHRVRLAGHEHRIHLGVALVCLPAAGAGLGAVGLELSTM